MTKHLYHGTCGGKLRAILKHGLRPRGISKSNWRATSRPDHVYLTNCYASFFAVSAMTPGWRPAILRIDTDRLDTANLYVDEDALEQANRHKDKAKVPDLMERTIYYRDAWDWLPEAREWEASLGYLGTCSHHGVIPPEAISGVAVIDKGGSYRWASDPFISRTNQRIMGAFYRAHTALPFEGLAAIERERANDKSFGQIAHLEQVNGFSVWMRPDDGWKPVIPTIATKASLARTP
jgi:hypothetical protein